MGKGPEAGADRQAAVQCQHRDSVQLAAGRLRRHAVITGEQAVPALRAASESGKDIYLREAALRSVLAIERAAPLLRWLGELSRSASFNVRAIAREAIDGTVDGDTEADAL